MKPDVADETKGPDRQKNRYTITALLNGLDVLESFKARQEWTLAGLAQHLELNKATLFRILSTLESKGFVTRVDNDGKYALGGAFLALGHGVLTYEQLRWQSLPPLQELAASVGESAHVGVIYEGEVVCVQLVDGQFDVRMHSSLGKRSPAHASSIGKSILAHYPDSEIEAFIERVGLGACTDKTITDAAEFKEHLRNVRARGYAVDDEEVQASVRCVGAPISNHAGSVIAGVSISGPSSRVTDQRVEEISPIVKRTALVISRMLGSPTPFLQRPS